MTCISRAASYLEKDRNYHSDDHIAVKILPTFIRMLIHIPIFRKLFVRFMAPRGVYEYVIARTRYIDAAFEKALTERFDQILLFGAGFDSRALRFRADDRPTRVFELDAPLTQQAKIRQYERRKLSIPSNLVFIAIDFDKESLSGKLDRAGFGKSRRSLFILEGLVMYLESSSVRATFDTIRDHAGAGSRIVFDYVQASVLRHEKTLYGEANLVKTVSKAGEQWRFGIEYAEIESFTETYGFETVDHKCARELEAAYFRDENGRPDGRINATHCIVTGKRRPA
jgi:methyltransferase (TIGR00027 family)